MIPGMEDDCMSFVHLLYGSNLNVLDDSVDKKLEELDGGITTIEKVRSSICVLEKYKTFRRVLPNSNLLCKQNFYRIVIKW